MRSQNVIWEYSGVGLLVFTTIFTLFFSFFYAVDGSNADYMYYMHLVAKSDYSQNAMIAGTLMLYTPVQDWLGNNYWLWRMFTWTINSLTLLIPYIALLNRQQQRRYAFVVALMMLVLQQRFGCEPYKLVYLFSILMLTCLVKYVKRRNIFWILFISLLISLIAFVRFPSFLTWPLMQIAIGVLNGKRHLMHTLVLTVIPPLIFSLLVSMTNDTVGEYLSELFVDIDDAATGGHSIDEIFISEVESIVHVCGYTFFIIVPFIMLALWKVKQKRIYWRTMIVGVTVMAAIMLYHPTQHLSCALMMVVTIFYWIGNRFCKESIVLGSTIIITAMLGCVGSDCGFVHDYMCACFLPYVAIHTPSIDISHHSRKYTKTAWQIVNNGLLHRLFIIIVLILTVSTFFNRLNNIYEKLYDNGEICALNAGKIAPNLQNIYLGKNEFNNVASLQKEFLTLSEKCDDVIFWGMSAHLMGIANDKWPIIDTWWIGHKVGNDKAIQQFEEYILIHRPAIIDTERHKETADFLLSLGYNKINHNYYDVYLSLTDFRNISSKIHTNE